MLLESISITFLRVPLGAHGVRGVERVGHGLSACRVGRPREARCRAPNLLLPDQGGLFLVAPLSSC